MGYTLTCEQAKTLLSKELSAIRRERVGNYEREVDYLIQVRKAWRKATSIDEMVKALLDISATIETCTHEYICYRLRDLITLSEINKGRVVFTKTVSYFGSDFYQAWLVTDESDTLKDVSEQVALFIEAPYVALKVAQYGQHRTLRAIEWDTEDSIVQVFKDTCFCQAVNSLLASQ